MLKEAEVAIQPGINPITQERFLRVYRRLVGDLRDQYDFDAVETKACLLAVGEWITRQPDYRPFLFSSLQLVFDREVTKNRHKGQNILVVQHPHHHELLLGLDPAGYLFGFQTIDTMPAALGTRRFLEQAFTRLYSEKHPGIQITAPGQDLLQDAQRLILTP